MSIYQHFRENEHPFIDRVLDWKSQVLNQYIVQVTEFLNPRERKIIGYVIGEQDEELAVSFFGGVPEAERQRAIIAPRFIPTNEDDFALIGLEASYPSKFVRLSHRDVLGAFTSLGIDRSMVGDIYVHADKVQLITTETFKEYVLRELRQIKNTSIAFKEVPLSAIEKTKEEWQSRHYTVSSLRLDTIVASCYRLSRQKASRLIASERVQLNYRLETNQATVLEAGDLLSVRGHGRCKLMETKGRTKKDKIRLVAGHLM